jgi:hypothetical protein
MPKPVELLLEVAKAFVRGMRTFHAEKSTLKHDEIASRQIHVLRRHQAKNEQPIKLHDVKELFEEMHDQRVRDRPRPNEWLPGHLAPRPPPTCRPKVASEAPAASLTIR